MNILSNRCFKQNKIHNLNYVNCSKRNIVKPEGTNTLNGVCYITSIHNSNFKSRNNVDRRRTRINNGSYAYSNIEISEEIKKNPKNKESYKRGYLSSF